MFCFKISGYVCVTNTAGNSHNGLFKTCAFGATTMATHIPALRKGVLGGFKRPSPAPPASASVVMLSGRDGVHGNKQLRPLSIAREIAKQNFCLNLSSPPNIFESHKLGHDVSVWVQLTC